MKTRFTLASASSATALALLLTPVAIAEDGATTMDGAAADPTNSGEGPAAGGDTTPAPPEGAEGEGAELDSQDGATTPATQVRDVELTISCQATPSKFAGVQDFPPREDKLPAHRPERGEGRGGFLPRPGPRPGGDGPSPAGCDL